MNINAEISDMRLALASLEAKAKAQQEPTLTPVSFESKGELAKALLDGRTFITPAGTTLMYSEETIFSSPFRIMRDGEDVNAMKGVWNSYAVLEEINAAEPWYLNIPPEGVQCYVSDVDPNPYLVRNTTGLVTKYDQSLLYPFQCYRTGWKYATPVDEGK